MTKKLAYLSMIDRTCKKKLGGIISNMPDRSDPDILTNIYNHIQLNHLILRKGLGDYTAPEVSTCNIFFVERKLDKQSKIRTSLTCKFF